MPEPESNDIAQTSGEEQAPEPGYFRFISHPGRECFDPGMVFRPVGLQPTKVLEEVRNVMRTGSRAVSAWHRRAGRAARQGPWRNKSASQIVQLMVDRITQALHRNDNEAVLRGLDRARIPYFLVGDGEDCVPQVSLETSGVPWARKWIISLENQFPVLYTPRNHHLVEMGFEGWTPCTPRRDCVAPNILCAKAYEAGENRYWLPARPCWGSTEPVIRRAMTRNDWAGVVLTVAAMLCNRDGWSGAMPFVQPSTWRSRTCSYCRSFVTKEMAFFTWAAEESRRFFCKSCAERYSPDSKPTSGWTEDEWSVSLPAQEAVEPEPVVQSAPDDPTAGLPATASYWDTLPTVGMEPVAQPGTGPRGLNEAEQSRLSESGIEMSVGTILMGGQA